MSDPGIRTFVFDTTTAALWAEEVAQSRDIPVDVVPAPAESDAKCDLALITPVNRGRELGDALTDEGVDWGVWPQESSAPVELP